MTCIFYTNIVYIKLEERISGALIWPSTGQTNDCKCSELGTSWEHMYYFYAFPFLYGFMYYWV